MRDGILIVASFAVFAALEALLYAFHHFRARRQGELKRRLEATGKVSSLGPDVLRRVRMASNPAIAAMVGGLPLAKRAESLLDQTDSKWTVAQLYAICIGGFAFALFLGAVLQLGLFILMVGPVGALLPLMALRISASRRSRRISEQLPDALDTMARSLRAGHAISAAFQVVATELPHPIAIEFARAYEEQRLGLPLEGAVQQMSARAPNNGDLKIFVISTVIQRETGGNLAEILGCISETIRQRFRFQGKLKSLTAEGRASALVLGLLPVGVVLAVSMLNPGYLKPLTTTPQGKTITIYAITSWLLGLGWLKKMTNFDY